MTVADLGAIAGELAEETERMARLRQEAIRVICYGSRAIMARAERSFLDPRRALVCWRHRMEWAHDDLGEARRRRERVGRRKRGIDGDDGMLSAFLRRWSLLHPLIFGGRA